MKHFKDIQISYSEKRKDLNAYKHAVRILKTKAREYRGVCMQAQASENQDECSCPRCNFYLSSYWVREYKKSIKNNTPIYRWHPRKPSYETVVFNIKQDLETWESYIGKPYLGISEGFDLQMAECF